MPQGSPIYSVSPSGMSMYVRPGYDVDFLFFFESKPEESQHRNENVEDDKDIALRHAKYT